MDLDPVATFDRRWRPIAALQLIDKEQESAAAACRPEQRDDRNPSLSKPTEDEAENPEQGRRRTEDCGGGLCCREIGQEAHGGYVRRMVLVAIAKPYPISCEPETSPPQGGNAPPAVGIESCMPKKRIDAALAEKIRRTIEAMTAPRRWHAGRGCIQWAMAIETQEAVEAQRGRVQSRDQFGRVGRLARFCP